GPVCSLFAGIPSETVAEQLRTVLADDGHTELPENVASAHDPFDVFRNATTLGDNEARYVEAAFTAHEIEAVSTAEPTPGGHELIQTWHESGRPLAIVSNNSAAAVSTYLDLHNLRRYVKHVSARESPDAELLKPNPHLINQAVRALNIVPVDCALLGDSVTDIEASHVAAVSVLGYANKPGKRLRLSNAGADAVVLTLTALGAVR
ncbi:MAG: HAD hydrolase-like protein, partial [Pseudonocardiaceae bacterium]|nr:HAD hydrolase-like protein [Pseudonocardiaceae bacterium]